MGTIVWVHAGREVPCATCDGPVGASDTCPQCIAAVEAASVLHPMSPTCAHEDDDLVGADPFAERLHPGPGGCWCARCAAIREARAEVTSRKRRRSP